MALTKEQIQEQLQILGMTGGHRETAIQERVIPEQYKAYQLQCDQREITLAFPGLNPVRVIVTTPQGKADNAPLHVNFHGGGFIFLQDRDDDMYCAHIAVEAGAVVVDVDYASSKDAPFPMAFDQSYAVAQWAYAHCAQWGCDPRRLSVGGSSAGGNLAIAVAMKAKETGDFPVCLQILDYAATDNDMPRHDPALLRSLAFSTLYVGGDMDRLRDPYVSPYFASDEQLKGLPQTLFIAPKKCPFYRCNLELGMRMIEQGVKVTMKAYPDCTHGFTVRLSGQWQDAQQEIIQAIQTASL